jgi:hypothetical protein
MMSRTRRSLPSKSLELLALLALCGAAHGQAFLNAGFETNDFSNWTIVQTPNGQTLVQTVDTVDIDGPGPLSASRAGKFSVGNISNMVNHQAGIELTQMMNLTGGVEYAITFNWAALRTTGQVNDEGGVFSVVVGNEIVSTVAAGPTGPLLPRYGLLQGNFIPAASGEFRVGARITRPFLIPAALAAELHQWVDNFQIVVAAHGACCLNDGACAFLSEFNCNALDGVYRGDGSTCASANCPLPGGCCQFLTCQVLSYRQCQRISGVYFGNGSTCAGCDPQGTLMPLPAQSAVASSDIISRGMWFTAPRDFRITGLRVPDTSGQGVQNVELIRLPYSPPLTASTATNTFERLGRFVGLPSAHIFPVSITVRAGDVIGILGNCGAGTMMNHSSGDGNFQSSIFGQTLRLRRLSMTGNLNITPAQNIYGADLLQTVLARIEVYYAEAGPSACYANCDGSTVEPVLNVDDFTCFINRYAQAQGLPHVEQVAHYANCDGSTVAPALNVDDFTCFINAYAQGCP